MKLTSGSQEVQPIMPAKVQNVHAVNTAAVRITDATFDGFYEYPFDATILIAGLLPTNLL